jgi:hypothetical protein
MSDDDDDFFLSRFGPALPVGVSSVLAAQTTPKPSLGSMMLHGPQERHRWSQVMHSRKRKVRNELEVKATMVQLQAVASELSKHASRVGVRLSAKSVRDKHGNARGSTIRIFRNTKRSSSSQSRFLALTPQTTLDIAYSKGCAVHVASEYKCSPTAVNLARRAIASCFVDVQQQNLANMLLALSTAPVEMKKVAFHHLKFDETSEKCLVRLNSELKALSYAYWANLIMRLACFFVYCVVILAHQNLSWETHFAS